MCWASSIHAWHRKTGVPRMRLVRSTAVGSTNPTPSTHPNARTWATGGWIVWVGCVGGVGGLCGCVCEWVSWAGGCMWVGKRARVCNSASITELVGAHNDFEYRLQSKTKIILIGFVTYVLIRTFLVTTLRFQSRSLKKKFLKIVRKL